MRIPAQPRARTDRYKRSKRAREPLLSDVSAGESRSLTSLNEQAGRDVSESKYWSRCRKRWTSNQNYRLNESLDVVVFVALSSGLLIRRVGAASIKSKLEPKSKFHETTNTPRRTVGEVSGHDRENAMQTAFVSPDIIAQGSLTLTVIDTFRTLVILVSAP